MRWEFVPETERNGFSALEFLALRLFLKIQVDNDESWGGRQGEKGCLLWYLSIILNPAFIDRRSLRSGFFLPARDHKEEGWSVLFQSFIFLWGDAAGGRQSSSSTSIGPTVSLALALVQFPYPSRGKVGVVGKSNLFCCMRTRLWDWKEIEAKWQSELLAYRILKELWTFAPFCLAWVIW